MLYTVNIDKLNILHNIDINKSNINILYTINIDLSQNTEVSRIILKIDSESASFF